MTATNQNDSHRRRRLLIRGLVVTGAAGLVLALTGAFNTGGAPLWLRLAYWVPLMFAGALWAHLCSLLVARFIDLDERPWLSVLALMLVIAIAGREGRIVRALPHDAVLELLRRHERLVA